jgi:hypothetical protein
MSESTKDVVATEDHSATCASRDPQTEKPCDCNETQRLRDLVRYCRHQLHEEGLISDEEFTDLLSNTPGAVGRLEAYDKVIARTRARDAVVKDVVDALREARQTINTLLLTQAGSGPHAPGFVYELYAKGHEINAARELSTRLAALTAYNELEKRVK